MKHIKALFIMVVCMTLFTACPKHDDTELAAPNRKLQVAAAAGSQTYTVSDLKLKIETLSCTDSWLTVGEEPYNSGSPKVKLEYTENTGNEREAVVTIKDTGGNLAILTVTQLKPGDTPELQPGQNQDYGIDDSHDVPTDQPAYSRQW